MQAGMIELLELEKHFGMVKAVNRADLVIPHGAFMVLLGPSGCGKTTILRMLAGLEKPTGGEIHFDGKLVASGRQGNIVQSGDRNIGMVFQSYALWPHMTVRANVEWPLKVKKWPVEKRKERIEEVLSLLAISELANRYPSEISGGQQQRAAIARTIAPRPKILLLDEPLSNLDAKLRVEMRIELLRVHRLTGATCVYVTHDQVEAMTMATHVAVMQNGHIEQVGSPRDLLEAPATPFVATFIGTPPANLLLAEARSECYFFQDVPLALTTDPANSKTWLMYRPDSIRLSQEPRERSIKAELAEATPMAGRALVALWSYSQRFNVIAEDLPDAHPGDTIYMQFPPQPDLTFPV